MKKLKVVTVVGTRPEVIRLSCVIKKLDQFCNHILVHTGQNYDYELNEIFFKDLDIRKPDYFLDSAGETGAQTIGNVIIALDSLLRELNPDALLILGDTNSCTAALPAKRLKIPIFHMEAGNRCFDLRVPEEINRRMVDHMSDINLTYSSIARYYLLQEGLPADMIIKIGSPMMEVLTTYQAGISSSRVLDELSLQKHRYFVVSFHREENILSDNLIKFIDSLNTIGDHFNLPIIFSTHPRTEKRLAQLGLAFHPLVKQIKPLGFFDYNKLQIESKAVLSDSGTISEESSILNFPALNIRDAHERPEGMEEAAVMMVGLNKDRIMQGLSLLETQPRDSQRLLRLVDDYSPLNVSDKVVRIIHSYVDYVNRVVWKKY